MEKLFRWLVLLILIGSLAACFTWIRAYRTYLQMDEFDQYFSITADEAFSLHFKSPILFSDDFTSLSKIQPTESTPLEYGKIWRYWFIKVDEHSIATQPETRFYFDLDFNTENRLTRWTFSPLFLQIAPAEFLEVSLRSIGGARINKEKRQLKANTDSIKKISAALPKKADVLSQLGEPLEIENGEAEKEIYRYHFLLDTDDVEEGYEDRTLSTLRLTFDKNTNELIRMSGRFAGLKISINYRKLLKSKQKTDV